MTDTNPYGYDAVDEVVGSGGKYLHFKKGDKGRVIQIRITSEPRYIQQHWITDVKGRQSPVNCEGKTCAYCGETVSAGERLDKVAKWGWVVVDREDGMVKIFTGPTLIARSIKEISELQDMRTKEVMWGDPRTYDIQIERAEEPGKGYYKVVPIGAKAPLTPEEEKLVTDANYNLEEELKGGKKSDGTGNYSAGANLETAPDDTISPDEIPAGLVGDDAVTDEDIPF